MSRKKVIVIGIPCFAGVSSETLEDYMRFAYYLGRRYQEYEFCLAIKAKTEQFRARNAIVMEARKLQADYLFFLDDDHVIDIDGMLGPSAKYEFLRKMIQLDKDIVGGLYWQRGGTYHPVALMQVDDVKYRLLESTEIERKPQKVDVVGGGFMLIKMDIFDKISEPFFEPEHTYGTDIQLCRKAKLEANAEIWLDSSIDVGHVIKEQNVLHSGNIHRLKAEREERIEKQKDPERFGHLKEVKMVSPFQRVIQDLTNDIMEYLNIYDIEELLDLANSHDQHQLKFHEYKDRGEYEKYYQDAGRSYLARACFIHNMPQTQPLDNFILEKFINGNGTGFDFGCGCAPITFELCRRGYRMNFLDIEGSPPFEFLKWRAKKYGLYDKNAFFPGKFVEGVDFVFALDSIEHLYNWREIVDSIAESLVEGGTMISNFIILGDRNNHEHVFLDKPKFLKYAAEKGLWQISNIVWQKRLEINMTSVKEK